RPDLAVAGGSVAAGGRAAWVRSRGRAPRQRGLRALSGDRARQARWAAGRPGRAVSVARGAGREGEHHGPRLASDPDQRWTSWSWCSFPATRAESVTTTTHTSSDRPRRPP